MLEPRPRTAAYNSASGAVRHSTARQRVLVVNDDRRMASSLAQWLCSNGWHAQAVGTPEEAISALGRHRCDHCLLDANLPAGGAARVGSVLRSTWPEARLIAMTGRTAKPTGTAQPVPRSLQADCVLATPIADAAVLAALTTSPAAPAGDVPTEPPSASRFLGESPAMRHVLEIVDRIAATPATVLLTGESGTGKSLLAREIHRRSQRADRRLVEVACGSLSESLLPTAMNPWLVLKPSSLYILITSGICGSRSSP